MADPQDPRKARFRPPDPRLGAKQRAAILAFLSGNGGDLIDPNAPPQPSAIERARAAYAREPEPVNLNWLTGLLDAKPRDVRNWLVDMVRGAAENPMAALAPVPGGAVRAAQLQRGARLKAYRAHVKNFDASRMREVNEFMAQQRSPFSTSLEPPPARTASRKEYTIERSGPRIDVLDAVELPPERITLEQARALGIAGPEEMSLPVAYRFTRRGPGVDVFDR